MDGKPKNQITHSHIPENSRPNWTITVNIIYSENENY